jgi:hypothetical protein
MEDNPIIGIKTKNKLLKRINKLSKVGLIKKHLSKNNGNKLYFTISPIGYTLYTNQDIPYSPNGIHSIAQSEHSLYPERDTNSKYNIDKYNIDNNIIDNKNRKKFIYISSLSELEKELLIVIYNLQDLFAKYNLTSYPIKDYYTAYKEILKQGYTKEQLLITIFARVYNITTNKNIEINKLLETISNPKYTIKNIDQLLVESKTIINQLKRIYGNKMTNVKNVKKAILYTEFLKQCYFYDYNHFMKNKTIHYSGIFRDTHNQPYNLKNLEKNLILIKQYLYNKGYKLTTEGITTSEKGIRYLIIYNSINNFSYCSFIKKLLYGLLVSEIDKNIDLTAYENIKDLVNLYNKYLNKLEINSSLDDIVSLLEEKIAVDV